METNWFVGSGMAIEGRMDWGGGGVCEQGEAAVKGIRDGCQHCALNCFIIYSSTVRALYTHRLLFILGPCCRTLSEAGLGSLGEILSFLCTLFERWVVKRLWLQIKKDSSGTPKHDRNVSSLLSASCPICWKHVSLARKSRLGGVRPRAQSASGTEF